MKENPHWVANWTLLIQVYKNMDTDKENNLVCWTNEDTDNGALSPAVFLCNNTSNSYWSQITNNKCSQLCLVKMSSTRVKKKKTPYC